MADDLLTTVLLATRAPVLVAPSMNVHMFENPIVQENLERLRARGCRIVDARRRVSRLRLRRRRSPGGAGRYRLPRSSARWRRPICAASGCWSRPVRIASRIDPVRFVSNRSTGKMGYALAAAAWRRGAEVALVSGPTALPAPHGVRRVAR